MESQESRLCGIPEKEEEFVRSVYPVFVDVLDAVLENLEANIELLLRYVQWRDVPDVGLAARQEHQPLLEGHVRDLVPALGRVLLALPVLDELVGEHHDEAACV